MKFYLSISFLLLMVNASSAQTIDEQKMFLKTISNHNENGIIPYIKERYSYDLASILKHRSLDLSPKNIHEILENNQQITLESVHFSPMDSLTFIIVKQDSVFNYLQKITLHKSEKRRYFHERNDIESMKKIDQFFYHYVYGFGIPLYFNNNQSCLIQSIEYCGGCGVTKISVFNKIENDWELVKSEITGEF